ncbi:MAG: hypothetical protein JRF38_01545 [Deltaproteobacteria bacterium]|nr:hypothetical protein [Deltaproteobacteria bacterium]
MANIWNLLFESTTTRKAGGLDLRAAGVFPASGRVDKSTSVLYTVRVKSVAGGFENNQFDF